MNEAPAKPKIVLHYPKLWKNVLGVKNTGDLPFSLHTFAAKPGKEMPFGFETDSKADSDGGVFDSDLTDDVKPELPAEKFAELNVPSDISAWKALSNEKRKEIKEAVNHYTLCRRLKPADIHLWIIPAPHYAIVREVERPLGTHAPRPRANSTHAQKQRFVLLGPAVATRDDIFAFRVKRDPGKPEERPTLDDQKHQFFIGVVEEHITTTDISRLILRKWTPDAYLFAEYKNIRGDIAYTEQLLNVRQRLVDHYCTLRVRHRPHKDPMKRIQELEDELLDVALLTGEELRDPLLNLSAKQNPRNNGNGKHLINAANLNQMICNMYDIPLFPRAVLAVDSEIIEWERALENGEQLVDHASKKARVEAFQAFLDWVNEFVGTQRGEKDAHVFPENGGNVSPVQRKTEFPCYIADQADLSEAEVLIRFISDIFSKEHIIAFKNDFEWEAFRKRRDVVPIQMREFRHWRRIFLRRRMETVMELMLHLKNPANLRAMLREFPDAEHLEREFDDEMKRITQENGVADKIRASAEELRESDPEGRDDPLNENPLESLQQKLADGGVGGVGKYLVEWMRQQISPLNRAATLKTNFDYLRDSVSG